MVNGQYLEDDLSGLDLVYLDELNDEVEIIEEDKKIEKINVATGQDCKRFIEYDDKTGHHKYTIRLLDEYFSNKINELIDKVNSLENKQ